MCLAKDPAMFGSGASIVGILKKHGFLPTCRVMQLLLWMYATADGGTLPHNFFVDVGKYHDLLLFVVSNPPLCLVVLCKYCQYTPCHYEIYRVSSNIYILLLLLV